MGGKKKHVLGLMCRVSVYLFCDSEPTMDKAEKSVNMWETECLKTDLY